jgi:hypothetical protein
MKFKPRGTRALFGTLLPNAWEITFKMARKKKSIILSQPVRKGIKAIKVRLDQRTIITLSDLKKLAFWKERYPKAEVIG